MGTKVTTMDVRIIGWLAAGVVVGFALGGLGPRRELQALSQAHADLQARLDRVERPNPLSMFLPQLDRTPEPQPRDATRDGASPASETRGAGPGGSGAGASEPSERAPGGSVAVIGPERQEATATPPQAAQPGSRAAARAGQTTGRDRDGRAEEAESEGERTSRRRPRLEDFDRIASVQRARLAASRAALIAQANLSDEQVAEVDATVTRMNDRLVGYGEEVITQMGAEEPPTPAQALGLGHDVSGVLFEGQQELDRIVGEARDGVEPEAMEIWNYVDVEQWRPFVDQQERARAGAPGTLEGASGQAAPAANRGGGPTSGTGGTER